MAGSQKTFELLFKLKASLGGDFNNTFKSAINTQKKLKESIKSVNSLQSQIDGYTKTTNAVAKQTEKLSRLQEEHGKISQKIQTHKNNAEQLQAEIAKNGDATGKLIDQLVRERNEVEKNTQKLKANESQIQQTNAKIDEEKEKLNSLGNELRKAGVNTDNLEESNARLKKSYERLKGSQENLNRINAEQAKIKQNITTTKTQLLGTIGAYGAVAAAVYAGPVQAAQKYETAIAKVSTIADNQAVPIQKMSSEVMKLSNTTGIAASQIADDVYNAISAGQKTGDAVNFVSYSTKLAKAGFAESSQTLDVLTTILNAYGMEAGKVSDVSDMLIQTQNEGKVSVGELSSVMGKIIPTANANSVALEQLCAGYAIMTAKGIKAAETTTYMNSMLNELSKSGTTADKTLRAATGQSFKELMSSGKSLGDTVNILQEEAKKSGKSLNDMFGSAEAGKAAVSLLSGGVDGFNDKVRGMVDSVGATEEAFAKMNETAEAKMQRAKNSIDNLGIVIGQNLLPIIGNMADKVAAVVVKVSEFAQANPKLVQTVIKVAAALAGMKIAGLTAKLGFLEISSGIKIAQKVFELFKIKAMGFSDIGSKIVGGLAKPLSGIGGIMGKALSGLGPLGSIAGKFLPIVGVITAVITAVQLLRNNLDKIREAVGNIFGEKGLEVFDKIVDTVTRVGEAIKSVFSDGNLGAARDKINEIFGDKGVAVFDTFAGVFQKVVSAAGQFVNFVTANIVPVAEQLLNVLITSVIPGIISGLQAAAPVIMQVITTIADFIGSMIPIIGSFIAGIMPIISEIITFIQTYVFPIISEVFNFIVSTVLPFLIQGIQTLGSVITTVLSAVLPVVQTVFQTIWAIIQPILTQILATVQAVLPQILFVFSTVFQTIGAVVQAAQQILSGLIQFITGVFTGNWGAAWEGVKNVFQGAWDGLTAIATGVINGIIGIINSAISALNSIQIPDWVPGVGGKGINIPTLPTFAKGTRNTPDTFIAGEEGPELITNAPGRVVYTAAQTRAIMSAQNAAVRSTEAVQAAGITNVTYTSTRQNGPQVLNTYSTTNNAQEVRAPEVIRGTGSGSSTNITINNNPVINIDGDNPEDLEEKLEENNRRLLQQVGNLLDKKQDDERRSRYE
ncbi:phage tail tape measure protein, TP901 family, core region [Lachnospiraceae bacterium M18-1]|nr:phage tail tape measure protein, TP901 family, core region [Lachnospiraceae bacterium M18-1]